MIKWWDGWMVGWLDGWVVGLINERMVGCKFGLQTDFSKSS